MCRAAGVKSSAGSQVDRTIISSLECDIYTTDARISQTFAFLFCFYRRTNKNFFLSSFARRLPPPRSPLVIHLLLSLVFTPLNSSSSSSPLSSTLPRNHLFVRSKRSALLKLFVPPASETFSSLL